jgi:anti-sigma factor ChrR (cupin superfamily)
VFNPLIIANIVSHSVEPDALDWRPFRQGVEIYPLHGDIRENAAAALLRYQPGAHVPIHTHTGYEYLLVLSGSQSDGVNIYSTGSFVVNAPGSSHAIYSEDGCVVLLIWEKPVSFDSA